MVLMTKKMIGLDLLILITKLLADIKYKKILPFTGVEGSGSREWGNFQEFDKF